MNIRAVIFDIYGTLLEVGPPRPDARMRWELLWQARLNVEPRFSLEGFSADCERVIAREHAAARKRGIAHPEIYWPEVVSEVLPEFAHLPENERSDFRFYHAQMAHTVRLMPGAAEVVRLLLEAQVRLGLASNCQPYTLRELETTLAGVNLSRKLFTPDLCFFSFEHGFSKPDPHVFQILTARLAVLGILPGETLMVGDRLDNDIEPAKVHGCQTWQLTASPTEGGTVSGDWKQFAHRWPDQPCGLAASKRLKKTSTVTRSTQQN
jgi:FMN phosphatase YigB (HAD superfamily)